MCTRVLRSVLRPFRCKNCLCAGGPKHVPYRSSKLTRILKPALGGNAQTAIICMVTLAAAHVDESTNTIDFSQRAKKVVNKVSVTETMSEQAALKRMEAELAKLKKQKVRCEVRTACILSGAIAGCFVQEAESQERISRAAPRVALTPGRGAVTQTQPTRSRRYSSGCWTRKATTVASPRKSAPRSELTTF